MTNFFLLCLALLCAVPSRAAGVTGTSGRETAISVLESDVRILCDSICGGRGAGSCGLFEASRFILSRMEEKGLAAGIRCAEVQGTAVHNVIGEMKGGGKRILVCAYYDGLGKINGVLRPGADSNASGVSAMLALIDSLKGRNVVFAAVDAHYHGNAGAKALKKQLSGKKFSTVISLETLGSGLAPVKSYQKKYLIALGGKTWRKKLESTVSPVTVYYDYYGSDGFTELFYRKISDIGPFLSSGIPGIVFTSGITDNTNRETDTPETLDYTLLAERVSLIAGFLRKLDL